MCVTRSGQTEVAISSGNVNSVLTSEQHSAGKNGDAGGTPKPKPSTPLLGEKLWMVEDVANYVRMKVQTIHYWNHRNMIPVAPLGRRLRFFPEEIMEWHRQGGTYEVAQMIMKNRGRRGK